MVLIPAGGLLLLQIGNRLQHVIADRDDARGGFETTLGDDHVR